VIASAKLERVPQLGGEEEWKRVDEWVDGWMDG